MGERTEGTAARVELLAMESTLVRRQFEHGQRLNLAIRVVVDTLGPYRPVTRLLLAPFLKVLSEFLGTLAWEDMIEPHADRVHLHGEQRVFLLPTSHEIHEYLVFGNTACHELSVATEDIPSVGLHTDAVALEARCHLLPVILLGSHDIGSLAHHRQTDDGQYHRYDEITRHYLVIFELAHSLTS